MLLADLCLGEMEIMIHHFESGMAKDFFKRKNITSINQVIDCKGMAT